MAWVLLVLSAVLEAVWATALGMSDGFTKPVPTVVFLVSSVVSFLGLSLAMKRIPLSVAYSVWVGLGAGLTVTWAMLTGAEPVSAVKILLLAGLIGSVVGLKFVKSEPPPRTNP
jgi:quaternary ammonium compound-resistance protein SugE